MSDWDASEDERPAAPTPALAAIKSNRWDDEDADEGPVKDSWSSDSDEDKPRQSAPANGSAASAAPVRRKGITKQKIAEKEAAEQARQEEAERLARLANDPAARKRQEREQQEKSDLVAAKALFGSAGTRDTDELLSLGIKTKEDASELAERLSDFLVTKHGSKPLYALFVEDFIKRCCIPLKDVEVRKAASGLTLLANEKQKVAKEMASGKKKSKGASKPVANVKGATRLDTAAYDDALDDDFDDDAFM
ncbi:uncharacterized protein L969DRAFT_357565 [Mixia osmundae IAM 14324]|uniref:Eukaryotic translation initiation factor 3 subunit J n=1 Tax=Mixia osmundae (strain CBS 9802 / IAM 14324 / JCM 22182 / KY 12970) TaxID=764103 RepID=G7E5A1_MIXOS|nr:uncharacterized protein L969DRAFT_357565 [Mixia osmundae IAM 14324]KEI40840.1 hypothetical protein L969DRAFT_357565 [Mixia osmundae IAM 14324]GAA98011.1 hypothetical protein E5Q_04691 [Mixia osmundae IAM 14324]